MTANFSLDGSIIPRRVKRLFDERAEVRVEARAESAVLTYRGRDHVVPLFNHSPSGAMVISNLVPHIAARLTIRMSGRDPVPGEVKWVRDGKIGLTFAGPAD